MGLLEEQEELKKQIAKAEKAEQEEPVEEKAKEAKEEPAKVEEPAKEEPAKEEAKPTEEAKPVEEEDRQKSPAEIRIERRKARELEQELAAMKARNAELERIAATHDKPKEAIPDKAEDPVAYLAWENEQLRKKVDALAPAVEEIKREKASESLKSQAMKEIEGYEAQVRAKNPDYDGAKSYYATMLATGIKMLNPDVTNAQLSQLVESKMIERAAKYAQAGYENPIDAMYQEAKKWGYAPAKAAEPVKELKPDPGRVAKNRERSAGTAAASGRGGDGEITPQYAATQMTVAEIRKLGPGKVRELIQRIGAE